MKIKFLLLLLSVGWLSASIIPAQVGNKWYYSIDVWTSDADSSYYYQTKVIMQIDSIKQIDQSYNQLDVSYRDTLGNFTTARWILSTPSSQIWRIANTTLNTGYAKIYDKDYTHSQSINGFFDYVDLYNNYYNNNLYTVQGFSWYMHGGGSQTYTSRGIHTADGLGVVYSYNYDVFECFKDNWSGKLYAVEFNGAYTPVGIKDNQVELLTCDLKLANYPNPFNSTTIISFENPVPAQVKLTVFDATGREVAQMLNKKLSGGKHSVIFNAEKLNSGVYFYQLELNGKQGATQKMLMVK